MIDKRFQIVESNFERLRQKFMKGELSREQFAEALRKLRLFDDQGKCWMLGAQSGHWYFYDGKKWVKADPPADRNDVLICPVCGQENDLQAKDCSSCHAPLQGEPARLVCPRCGRLLGPDQVVCPDCGALVKTEGKINPTDGQGRPAAGKKKGEEIDLWYLREADPLSFLLFFGGVGILLGILLGLMSGATEFFPGVGAMLPAFLQEMQGKLLGGLVYSFLGGLIGFAVMATAGFLLAYLINASIFFFGGPGFKLKKVRKRTKDLTS